MQIKRTKCVDTCRRSEPASHCYSSSRFRQATRLGYMRMASTKAKWLLKFSNLSVFVWTCVRLACLQGGRARVTAMSRLVHGSYQHEHHSKHCSL